MSHVHGVTLRSHLGPNQTPHLPMVLRPYLWLTWFKRPHVWCVAKIMAETTALATTPRTLNDPRYVASWSGVKGDGR